MTVRAIPITGLDGFLAALEGFGVDPMVESGLVMYSVTPLTGGLAGQIVPTGVTLDEVAPWPSAPPHWIHLPSTVAFASTNAGGSPKEGWASHSRDIPAWGTAEIAIAAWLAHVRGVVGGAP